jgi:hypothetical protein
MVFRKKKKEKEIAKENNPSFSVSTSTMPVKSEGEGFTAEDIRLIINEWLKEEHTHFKTRYTKRQVRAITKLQPIADRYKIKCLQDVLNEFRIAKLSEEGQSSKELVDILKERLTGMMEEKTTVNKSLGRFFE